jgi:hypothetical protein
MNRNSTKIIFLFSIVSISNILIAQTKNQPEINVVYGDKHIFTIETPEGWVNDKEAAQQVGLVCFFYPKSELNKNHLNYCYVFGYDKKTSDETLENFIKGDLEKFHEKYSDYTYEKIPVNITGELKNCVLYSFSKLTDRFKEEVLYSETDETFIIFSFSAQTENDYKNFQQIFNSLISSFKYRGNNPKPFLDYMKSKQK